MTTLIPTENSQVFKRLYTEKARVFDKLKKKSELCRDYCEILGVSVDKSRPGQNEYKQLSFDKQCSIPNDRAQKVINLHISHINDVEAEIKEPLFSEQDIQNTPGLARCKAQKQDALYDKKLGNITLQLNEFYQSRSETAFNGNIIHKPALQRIFNIPILAVLVSVVILYTTLKPVASTTIEEVYTQEKHDDILNQREKQITDELSVLYRNIKANNKQNEKLISLLEKKLNETRWDLSTTKSNMASYHNELAFLQERNNYLDSIKDQLAPELYQEAHDALIHGDKLKAYKLYENFKQKGESTIEQIALANFEQGVIDEDRLKYKDAFVRYERAAYLQAENSEFNNKAGFLANTLGHFNKAIEYFEKALENDLKTFDENHPDVASSWNNLGVAWKSKGQYDKAIGYYEKALASNLKTFGEDHSNVAERWNNLGETWRFLGQYDKAIEYHEMALPSQLMTFGEDHPKVAESWNNLGVAWEAKGRYDRAIEYFEKALSSDLITYGEKHPQVAIYWNNLGAAWNAKGQYDKAIGYFEKALANDLKTFGEDHPKFAIRLNNLGMVWKGKGQYDKAIKYVEKSLAVTLKIYGEEHPNVAIDWNNLGKIWYFKSQHDKSIMYYEKALPIFKIKLGEDHHLTKKCLNNLNLAKQALLAKVD